MKENRGNPLQLTSLNHISLVCRSVQESIDFYQNILGFVPVRRPGSFNFDGAWLFNCGIGIHLLQSEEAGKSPEKREINPKDNHISFQCESMSAAEKSLTEMGINYVRQRVEEGGIYVDQLFFHDPDGFMVEICNCDNLPVIPLAGETRDPTRRRNGSGVRARGLIVFRRLFSISNKYKSNHTESPKKAIPIRKMICIPTTLTEIVPTAAGGPSPATGRPIRSVQKF